MAFYGTITDAGRAFEARLKSEGKPLIFQRVSGGSGLTSDPATATDLMNERCAFFLKYSEPVDDRIEIYTTLDAESVSESFLWQQWGLWVGDGEGAEVLYLLSQDENGQIIDPGADIIDYKHTIVLSNDAEVTVIANPLGPVTQGDIGRAYGVVPLDGEAKVPVEHLPELKGTDFYVEDSALSTERARVITAPKITSYDQIADKLLMIRAYGQAPTGAITLRFNDLEPLPLAAPVPNSNGYTTQIPYPNWSRAGYYYMAYFDGEKLVLCNVEQTAASEETYGVVRVIDSLESTSETDALAARQGSVLATRIEGFEKNLSAIGTTSGTATALILDVPSFELRHFARVYVKLHINIGNNPTLNINGTGAKPIYRSTSQPLAYGMLAGSVFEVVYDSSFGRYIAIGAMDSSSGGSIMFNTAGSHTFTVPAGVRTVDVVMIGGGGGGGGGHAGQGYGGGGGGSGRIMAGTVSVNPGTNMTVVVGTGGSAGNRGSISLAGQTESGENSEGEWSYWYPNSLTNPTAGGNGGTSSFGSLSATGGNGGQFSAWRYERDGGVTGYAYGGNGGSGGGGGGSGYYISGGNGGSGTDGGKANYTNGGAAAVPGDNRYGAGGAGGIPEISGGGGGGGGGGYSGNGGNGGKGACSSTNAVTASNGSSGGGYGSGGGGGGGGLSPRIYSSSGISYGGNGGNGAMGCVIISWG